jgi:thiol-disulfide isomerase/thioredoxin
MLLLIISIKCYSQNSLFEFKLANIQNKIISFSDLKKYKAIAFVFLLSDCPASQDYTLTLNELYLKYKDNNIAFVGIFPGKFSTDEELLKFQKLYKVTFPLFKDPDFVFTKWLEAKIVPACFLLNNIGEIVYKGRINDWLFALGKKRMQITQNNLEDALNSIVKNKTLKIRETAPIGCILEY